MPKISLTPAEICAARTVKSVLARAGEPVPAVVERMSRVEPKLPVYDPATDWPDTYPDGGR